MTTNGLLNNASKTQFIWFFTPQHLLKIDWSPISGLGIMRPYIILKYFYEAPPVGWPFRGAPSTGIPQYNFTGLNNRIPVLLIRDPKQASRCLFEVYCNCKIYYYYWLGINIRDVVAVGESGVELGYCSRTLQHELCSGVDLRFDEGDVAHRNQRHAYLYLLGQVRRPCFSSKKNLTEIICANKQRSDFKAVIYRLFVSA